VPDFLEQWERLSKVIVVAGEVNRLNRTDQFRDIRLISFDLCTATLQYAPGYQVAITYTPTSDSYQASFYRAYPTSTPAAHTHLAATPAADSDESPHQQIALLLSHFLNELTSAPQKDGQGSDGKQFIQLLRSTLPLLLEAEALRAAAHGHFPALVVRSVTEYRLVWDNEGVTRYALDIVLTADARSFLLTDAARPRADLPADLSCGPLTPIPTFERVVLKGFQAARASRVATPGSVSTPAAMTPARGVTSASAAATAVAVLNAAPPALRLDNGQSILCATAVVQDVLRVMGAEIEAAIAAAHK
jgi:mediator of RNA polymerase II transcription subunit 14